jgi:hypothetical protein
MSAADDSGLRLEVDGFRIWALGDRADYGEWETEYGEWPAIWDAFRRFVELKPPSQWDAREWRDVLYAIARDNEDEWIVDDLVERHPDVLIAIAARARRDGEVDARWQLAVALGRVDVDRDACEALLLDYCDDDEEYVRRRALGALSVMGSRHAERIALEEWDRVGEEHVTRRQVVLDALVSEHGRLSVLLTAAEADQSAVLSEYAAHLRRLVADGGEGEMFRPSDAVLRELDEQLRDRLRERGIPAPPRDLYREPPSRLAIVLRRLSVRRKKRRAGTRSA